MSNDTVVINASPFILLCKCDLVDLLPKLFADILIPATVFEEVVKGNDDASVLVSEFRKSWLKTVIVPIEKEVEIWNLGDGETELLSYNLCGAAESSGINRRPGGSSLRGDAWNSHARDRGISVTGEKTE